MRTLQVSNIFDIMFANIKRNIYKILVKKGYKLLAVLGWNIYGADFLTWN